MQYCPHCMKPATGAKCPNCGGDMSWTGQKGIDLPVGTVLTGGNGLRNYQIGAARGKGGFGITYIALETNSSRRMAIKEYFPTRCAFRSGNGVDVQAMTGQEDFFQGGMNSFLDEGKMLLAQDDLPSVVHVIDYFRANGTAYLVMEYLDGVALHTQMTQMGGRIPVSELMPKLAPLLRDIGQLHQRGVIHRDISPDNIMWMPDGGLKLMDFGSARSMESGKSMTVLMKQGFSPIEQYRSKGQGPYTDIYALAATIYYCVTGVIPQASVERLGEDLLQSPIALGAALTVQQETALLWALSLQPDARPQSMEEFAAMLYKAAEPQPQPPRGYPRPKMEQPRPATGQGTAYQPIMGQGTAYQPIMGQGTSYQPGQGQGTIYQPVTEQSPSGPGQNTAFQYGYSYNGQTPGQGQAAGPGQNQAGGKKNKLLIPVIAASAAVVVVLLVVGIVALNWGKTADTPTPSTRPTQSAEPRPSTASTPSTEPTQNIITGVTEDGYLYEIIDQNYAVLTGYEGDSGISVMPLTVEGVPITAIADNAFAGAPIDEYVLLPLELETIGANAFRGCSDLVYIVAYSDVATETTSFSGCNNLWFVYSDSETVSGWNLPSGVNLFYFGMETGAGPLEYLYEPDNGLLFGETEDDMYVLLDTKPWVYTLDLEWCDWICSWALDNPPYSIELGEYTVFPYEMYDSWNDWYAPEGSLADMWLMSCEAADGINAVRPYGATPIEPDLELLVPAMVRAEELLTVNDFVRPDGRNDYSALDDAGVYYGVANAVRGYQCYSRSEVFDDMPDLADYFASSLTAADDAYYAGEYYNRIGVAYSETYAGEYLYYVFVRIS